LFSPLSRFADVAVVFSIAGGRRQRYFGGSRPSLGHFLAPHDEARHASPLPHPGLPPGAGSISDGNRSSLTAPSPRDPAHASNRPRAWCPSRARPRALGETLLLLTFFLVVIVLCHRRELSVKFSQNTCLVLQLTPPRLAHARVLPAKPASFANVLPDSLLVSFAPCQSIHLLACLLKLASHGRDILGIQLSACFRLASTINRSNCLCACLAACYICLAVA
jgi:hypothetical protein